MSRIMGFLTGDAISADAEAEHKVRMLQRLPGQEATWVEAEDWRLGVSGTYRGQQHFQSSQLSVVMDGYILNYQELQQTHRVQAEGTAHLIAELYKRLGVTGMLSEIWGEFAISLYDHQTKTLYACRDRLGVKPLYVTYKKGVSGFASQPFALLDLPGVGRDVNTAFAARFLGLHYRLIDNDRSASPFEDIYQVPAGSYVMFPNTQPPKEVPYWQLEDRGDFQEAEQYLAEAYKELLLDAVNRRYKTSSAPVFTLSGGLDSSSVLCSALRMSGHRLSAISTIYKDKTYDEREEIQDILDAKDVDWTPIELDNDVDMFEIIPQMVRIHNEPVATSTWLSHYLLCGQLADKGYDAIFGGLGGDELNAGEYEYFPMLFADYVLAGDQRSYAQEVEDWQRHHDHPIFKKNRTVADNMLTRMVDLEQPGSVRQDPIRMMKYAKAVHPDFFDFQSFEVDMSAPYGSYLKNRTYQDLVRETTPCCLRAEDRQAQYYGMQNLDPFLDHRLVEFMFQVPGQYKIRNGITKRLLRLAMKGVLPEETRLRIAKSGWNAPAHQWFMGQNLSMLRDLVASQSFRNRGVYDVVHIQTLISEHEKIVLEGASTETHMMFLWQLLNLEFWFQAIDKNSRM